MSQISNVNAPQSQNLPLVSHSDAFSDALRDAKRADGNTVCHIPNDPHLPVADADNKTVSKPDTTSHKVTTMAVGEEGDCGGMTTMAFGEEGDGGGMTTMAVGEESDGGGMTTMALGEEGGVEV